MSWLCGLAAFAYRVSAWAYEHGYDGLHDEAERLLVPRVRRSEDEPQEIGGAYDGFSVTSDAGVRYRKPHMARHTGATRYIRKGGRLSTLTSVLGHSSEAITSDLYVHLDTRDAALDMALVEVED